MAGKHKKPEPVEGLPVFATPDDACRALGCPRSKLLELERKGLLRPVRLGKTMVRYRASDLEKLGEAAS